MSENERSPIRVIIVESRSESAISAVLRELGVTQGTAVNVERIEHVREINYVSGQAGAVGSRAHSEDATFMQIPGNEINLDLATLASQLTVVRVAMKGQATLSSAEQDEEVGHVARAEIAAKKGDAETVKDHLKQVGGWTLNVARETGAEIVALYLAHLTQG
jgi:hypothetical protein